MGTGGGGWLQGQKPVLRGTAFVLRCSGAATVAYELASFLGLHEALWAAMSALIVSQEQLHQTRSSLGGFISGTLLGIGITVGWFQPPSRWRQQWRLARLSYANSQCFGSRCRLARSFC